MELTFVLRRAYGHNRYYPACTDAHILVDTIAERRCLSHESIMRLATIGARITVVDDTSEVLFTLPKKSSPKAEGE